MAMWNEIKNLFGKKPLKARLAINAKPVSGSWGGGNQWMFQTSRLAEYLGFEVVYQLDSKVDCILVLHSADSQGATFNAADIEKHKKKFPHTKCLHRINENDARKDTTHMDAAISKMNQNADFTVFVSRWLRDYHQVKWFDGKRPHEIIINGADSRFFHPYGGSIWSPSSPFILATHHWSDNWNKGFDVYKEIDEKIASGVLKNIELHVIGRWPVDLVWKSAKTFPPASGMELAGMLRNCHGYVTGTKNEPGAMHYIEGLQCGLPLLYRVGGGGVDEVGKLTGGIEFQNDPTAAIEQLKQEWTSRRRQVLENLPSGEKMAFHYLNIVQKLLLS